MTLLNKLFGEPEEINGRERCPTYLSQQELAEIRRDFQDRTVHRLLDHIEAQRVEFEAEEAEVLRLRELFALVPHESRCNSRSNRKFDNRCNCIKSKVGPL